MTQQPDKVRLMTSSSERATPKPGTVRQVLIYSDLRYREEY